MTTALDIPDFLNGVVTPTSPNAYTEDDRRELRELAVHLLVDSARLQRAGRKHRMHYLLHVQPAIEQAVEVGWDRYDIRADADREYGQWLINNAGK